MTCQKSSSTCSNVTNNTLQIIYRIIYSLLPLLDNSSKITKIPHLANSDVDLVMPNAKNYRVRIMLLKQLRKNFNK